jgi:hypothetical protein
MVFTNLGEIAEIVNSTELQLQIGSAPHGYILLRDLQININRIENRFATTGGLVYTYGKGDNSFTATMIFTGDEVDGTAYSNTTTPASFNELTTPTDNGDLNSIAWKILATDVSGGTKTFAATGVLRDYSVRKNGAEGVVEIDIFVRITGDTISIS